MVTGDDFGNDMDKKYNELTSKELHSLVEGLVVRLNLFQREYPNFLE